MTHNGCRMEELAVERLRDKRPDLRGKRLIADKGHLPAVGRPGRDINGALAAKQPGQHADFTAAHRHQAQHHVLVGRMALHVLGKGKKHDPFPVR